MTSKQNLKEGGFTVHAITSAEGAAILQQHRLSISELAKAITAYLARERVPFGTFLGVHETFGVFFSEDSNWSPDLPDAFAAHFGVIPWVQIHELLGNVPDGTTLDFLNTNEQNN